jgi:hypothetical protein
VQVTFFPFSVMPISVASRIPRPLRVVFHTGTHHRLRMAEEGILFYAEENVLDERDKPLPLNYVLSYEAPIGFTFCKTLT